MKVPFADAAHTYIYARPLSGGSRRRYLEILDALKHRLDHIGIAPEDVSLAIIASYEQSMRARGLSDNTVYGSMRLIKDFYRWMADEGLLPEDPLRAYRAPRKPVIHRATLTVNDMQAMWSAASSARDRVVFGLLAINSLKNRDIVSADIRDVVERDGQWVLHLRSRPVGYQYPWAVLTPPVLASFHEYTRGRLDGPLLLSLQGRRGDRRVISTIVQRLADDAGIGRVVEPLTVALSMRDIAISRGFSFVAVARTTGVVEPRKIEALVSRAPMSLSADAAFRMAQLIAPQVGTSGFLVDAEALLYQSDAPPATSVMLAGAALERHLRGMAAEVGVILDEDRAKITNYAPALKAAEVISGREVKLLIGLAAMRNRAAHGWFEDFAVEDVKTMLNEVTSFIKRHPLRAEPAS